MTATARNLLLAITLGLMTGCSGLPPGGSDYARFGGREGIAAIVEDTLVRSAEDPRIAHHFANADLVHLHDKLSEQICVQVGGPCSYTGFPMPEVHDGRNIDAADFNAVVEHLMAAMDARDVPRTAQNRLLKRLAAMRGDVIER